MLPFRALSIVLLASLATAQNESRAAEEIDLAGEWRFALDPEDVGVAERWWERSLPDRIQLPGILQAQGYGDEVSVDTKWTADVNDRAWFEDEAMAPYREPGNVKIPFWLQPDRHYVGAAWYQRDVEIPASWAGREITVELERSHWTTEVIFDGESLGGGTSLSTPHRTTRQFQPTPGRHTLTVRVDNRMHVDVGINAHSVSDHTQSNWNGVVGRLRLRAEEQLRMPWVQVRPDAARRRVWVHPTVYSTAPGLWSGDITVSARTIDGTHVAKPIVQPFLIQGPLGEGVAGASIEIEYELGEDARLWDEFQPALYELEVTLDLHRAAGGDSSTVEKLTATKTVRFGLRDVTTSGTRILVNGRPAFLRGTLECCIFPRTGHPPMEVEEWRRILQVCKDHGLNHVRFHSWCPPEAAFVAADELGIYFQVEAAAWARIGDGAPVDAWIQAEARSILFEYGNHPSFLMLAYGNEPAGAEQREYLAELVTQWKKEDPSRLYTSAAGWPIIPESDFHSTPTPRIHSWGAGLGSRINAKPPETVTDYREFVAKHDAPVVSHEIGQWCVYPDFEEIPKYTGYLRPKNFEIFRDTLTANHMGDQARDFLMASGKLQLTCYKEDVESALRTPGFGGFQLLDLHDFPGQGTALVGVLDPFWDSKPYCTPAEFRRFCGPTVPLARLAKRVFTSDETIAFDVEVAHYGSADLEDSIVAWRLESLEGEVFAARAFPSRTIPTGELTKCGRVEVSLAHVPAPQAVRLAVSLADTKIENDWNLWVYPPAPVTKPIDYVLLTRDLDEALEALAKGGRVVWTPPPHRVVTDVALGFSSIFWNTSWTRGQPPHTLGILCDPQHQSLSTFPTDFHSDWQWWYAVANAAAFPLDGFPPELRPLVQVVPDWFTNQRLALVFEALVGPGRLLVSSIDLEGDLEDDPVRRQLRASLLGYAAGYAFVPRVQVDPALLRASVRPPSVLERLGATVTADSAHGSHPATFAIDGDPTTIWHTPWGDEKTELPHHLTLDLRETTTLTGLRYVPRQDMENGRIAAYELYVGDDPADLGTPVATGTWPSGTAERQLSFAAPAAGRYLRLVARSEVNGNFFSAVAELDVLTD